MKLALPSGRLFEGVEGYLARHGIDLYRKSDRDYSPGCNVTGVKVRIRKVRDVPQPTALGIFDAGFTGHDVLVESGYADRVVEVADLGCNPVRLMVAAHETWHDIVVNPPSRPVVIVSEFPNLASQWAYRNGLSHVMIPTTGKTEGWVPEDADICFDVVETGETMEANGLVVLDEILTSTTRLVVNREVLERDDVREFLHQLEVRP
ncbi:ATP phosphoribosyltransferase [Patescibacteria group bacterium]